MKSYRIAIIDGMSSLLANPVIEAFKILLETKHLYQSQKIVYPEFDIIFPSVKNCFNPISDPILSSCKQIYEDKDKYNWLIMNGYYQATKAQSLSSPVNKEVVPNIEVLPPTIKIFCPICKDVEPYNFNDGNDILPQYEQNCTMQVFYLTYQCQGCKSIPEIFLIRRDGQKITLHGRSPMEVIQTPTFIPKKQRTFYSDAIIAFNSGQVLAGVFLLRTFIEQYVREVNNNPTSKEIDKLFDDYSSKLPSNFKQSFPSLNSIYERLSIAIHSAEAEDGLFQKAIEDIDQHFDAKRVHKILL